VRGNVVLGGKVHSWRITVCGQGMEAQELVVVNAAGLRKRMWEEAVVGEVTRLRTSFIRGGGVELPAWCLASVECDPKVPGSRLLFLILSRSCRCR
jgi:hypothetical protein